MEIIHPLISLCEVGGGGIFCIDPVGVTGFSERFNSSVLIYKLLNFMVTHTPDTAVKVPVETRPTASPVERVIPETIVPV